jgi:hypothetical protein
MAKLLDEYAAIAPWDVSTRQTNEGIIRRLAGIIHPNERVRGRLCTAGR